MALKASKEAQKTIKSAKVPNKRERAAAQFGQLDDLSANFWATASPKTIQEAIERLAKAVSDNGVTPIPQ